MIKILIKINVKQHCKNLQSPGGQGTLKPFGISYRLSPFPTTTLQMHVNESTNTRIPFISLSSSKTSNKLVA
jgi:hypothetical protein